MRDNGAPGATSPREERPQGSGLPQAWDTNTEPFEDAIAFLNNTIKLVHINPNLIENVSNKIDPPIPGQRIPSGHAVLCLKDKESRVRLLQQSRLLKDTKFWIAEELTLLQLKHKEEELKKVRAARAKGKWAVYRGGKAFIQEFRTPKPLDTSSDHPANIS